MRGLASPPAAIASHSPLSLWHHPPPSPLLLGAPRGWARRDDRRRDFGAAAASPLGTAGARLFGRRAARGGGDRHRALAAVRRAGGGDRARRRRRRGGASSSRGLRAVDAEYGVMPPPCISPYLPASPHLSSPRRGLRSHASQPALERTRMQLHSAVVGRIQLQSPPSDSRGALKTLHHARLPALRCAYSARRLRARRVSPRLSRGAADPRPVRGGGGAVARLAAARHAPRRRGACRLVARPAGRPRLPHARAGLLAGALRAGRGREAPRRDCPR